MRKWPSWVELAILGTLAIVCGAVVNHVESREVGILAATFPVVLVAGLMGLRRNAQPVAPKREEAIELEEVGS